MIQHGINEPPSHVVVHSPWIRTIPITILSVGDSIDGAGGTCMTVEYGGIA